MISSPTLCFRCIAVLLLLLNNAHCFVGLRTNAITVRRAQAVATSRTDSVQCISQENFPASPLLGLIRRINETIEREDSSLIWDIVRYESAMVSEHDLKAAILMSNSILSLPSLEDAIIDFLANQLEAPLMPATQIRNLFAEVCANSTNITTSWELDLVASALNDDSQPTAVNVLLFNQGFHALATYRIANYLYNNGRDGIARYFQSLVSRIFGSDIHPAARIGHGCYVSTASGLVIGETAAVGNDCIIHHGVTLGGTGKESGDRHPKVGDRVFISAGATILGNIPVGDGAVIDAEAVVNKPVAPYTRVGGVPAKFLSYTYEMNGLTEDAVLQLQQQDSDQAQKQALLQEQQLLANRLGQGANSS